MNANFLRLPALFLLLAGSAIVPASAQTPAADSLKDLLQQGLFEEEANRNPEAAAKAYQAILDSWDTGREFAATALYRLAEIDRKAGRNDDAIAKFRKLLVSFPDREPLARLARENLDALGGSPPDPADAATGAADPEEAAEIRRVLALAAQSPDLIHTPDGSGQPPLHNAAAAGRLRLVTVLLDHGADVNGRDKNQKTALHFAAENGHLAVAKLLVERGAEVDVKAQNTDIQNRGTATDVTPLHLAIGMRRAELASYLIAEGADINIVRILATFDRGLPKELHETPLSLAWMNGLGNVVDLILEKRPDLDVPVADGVQDPLRPLLYLVLSRGKLEFARRLVEHGARLHPYYASAGFSLDGGRERHLKVLTWLLENGLSATQADDEGRRPIHFVRTREAAELLVSRGADPASVDNAGRNALVHTVLNGDYPEFVQWLLDRGLPADYVVKGENGKPDRTLIQAANYETRIALVRRLWYADPKGTRSICLSAPGDSWGEFRLMEAQNAADPPPDLVGLLVFLSNQRDLRGRSIARRPLPWRGEMRVFRTDETGRAVEAFLVDLPAVLERREPAPDLQWGDVIELLEEAEGTTRTDLTSLIADRSGVRRGIGVQSGAGELPGALETAQRTVIVERGGGTLKLQVPAGFAHPYSLETLDAGRLARLFGNYGGEDDSPVFGARLIRTTPDGEFEIALPSEGPGTMLREGDRVIVPELVPRKNGITLHIPELLVDYYRAGGTQDIEGLLRETIRSFEVFFRRSKEGTFGSARDPDFRAVMVDGAPVDLEARAVAWARDRSLSPSLLVVESVVFRLRDADGESGEAMEKVINYLRRDEASNAGPRRRVVNPAVPNN